MLSVGMDMIVTDGAPGAAQSLATALRPTLGPHPVPQSDPHTRGLLFSLPAGPGRTAVLAGHPALAPCLSLFAPEDGSTYLVAVNETPPGPPDSFLMRPHLDRRWTGSGFSDALPHRVSVAFLDFPPEGDGGELAVFPAGQIAVPASRAGARQVVAAHGATLVSPRPGRVCHMAGTLPHAVLSYQAAGPGPWRMVLVVAAFADG